jgi:methyl-coenzyme M reductase subunit D
MDIEIFPHRMLGPDTTEKMLNDIENLEDVNRTIIHGPRLPPDDPELPDKYKERRIITVKGQPIELKVRTGRILVELTSESAINEVDQICSEHLPFGYDINTSKREYIRKERTVSDAIKYGPDENLPDELVGMTDARRQMAENLDFINDDME